MTTDNIVVLDYSTGKPRLGYPTLVEQRDRSYAMMVRDAIMDRVKGMPFFSLGGFHFSTNTAEQIQPQTIPLAGVYLISETTTPDGDPNAGEVRFRSMAAIGISFVIQNNDAAAAERTLDKAWSRFERIFADSTLYNNKDFKVQAFVNGSRTHVFGSAGKDNEIPIAEMRFNLTVDLGTITYPPAIYDDLETVHLETRYPAGSDPAEVQQAVAEYDVESDA